MGGKLWRRITDEKGMGLAEEVDPGQLKIERPTLVYLSGFLTNNNRPGYVEGSIRRIEELLKSAPADAVQPDMYAWSHKGLSNLFNLAIYDSFPNSRSSAAGYTLAESVLMPLVAEDFKRLPDGSVQGRPLPPEEAARKLRNVTFFGYSAGCIVAQETFNATLKIMKDIGYDEKDARKLMKEVVLVATGCFSRYTKERDRFTTVILTASNDRINRGKNWIWGFFGTLRRTLFTHYTKDKNKKPLTIRPLSLSSLFINAAVRASTYEYKVAPTGEYKVDTLGHRIKKRLDTLYPAWMHRRSYHELPHYVTIDPENNGFARIALYTTVNAVNRACAPEPLKLLDIPAHDIFAPEAQEAYRQRIQQALKPMPAKLAKQ